MFVTMLVIKRDSKPMNDNNTFYASDSEQFESVCTSVGT